jgi:hypothetical protein
MAGGAFAFGLFAVLGILGLFGVVDGLEHLDVGKILATDGFFFSGGQARQGLLERLHLSTELIECAEEARRNGG